MCKGQGVGNVARGKGARGGDRGRGGAVDRVVRYLSRKLPAACKGRPLAVGVRCTLARVQERGKVARFQCYLFPFDNIQCVGGYLHLPKERRKPLPLSHPTPLSQTFFRNPYPHLETFLGKQSNCCAESVWRKMSFI